MIQWSCTILTAALIALVFDSTARADDVAGIEFFETQIRPLLIEHCYECHSLSSQPAQGQLRLDSKPGWASGGENGPAIIPGDPEASSLIQRIQSSDESIRMPPAKALSSEEIESLRRWIQMGAPDPRSEESQLSNDPMERQLQNPSDPVAGKEHWAFRPLKRAEPPAALNPEWARTPIDYFILARLDAAGLTPAAPTSIVTLARRISFQLTGLPPAAEDVQALQNDPSGAALESYVDRLLASRQFGERWGRHWLDLARYADSNGLDENFLFREAWRYRNWVIDAVNADQPYDRFLLEQIAGDLLAYDSIEQRDRQRIAAGFMVIGPKVLLGNDERKQRMEVADEQIDTIGRAVLGQTLGCARCHNHKFDPIPTADYYALVGILTSTQVMEQRFMLNEQRVMERLVGLGPDGESLDAAYEEFWRERPRKQKQLDRAKRVLELLKQGDTGKIAEIVADHPEALASEAVDASQPAEHRQNIQQAMVAQLEMALASPPGIPGRAMIPTEAGTPADEKIRLAGEFDRPGDTVPRGFLQVLCTGTVESIPADQSGRLQLSRWLVDVEHGAGALTARVLANRIWHHLIGQGLVRTVDNFGRTGEQPSHLELLDYPALRLIDSGWSMKTVIREVVLSQTFAMSSDHVEGPHEIDPENRLLWRPNRRRLDPESLRDAILQVSGTLDLTPMESTVSYLGDQATGVGENVRRRTDFSCRSVYLPVIRNDLPELFDVFDFANPHATTGARPKTMVAQQGLFLLNDAMVMTAAESAAKRLLADNEVSDDAARVDTMYQAVLTLPPTADVRLDLVAFVQQTQAQLAAEGDAESRLHAWSLAYHSLFALSRFQFLE